MKLICEDILYFPEPHLKKINRQEARNSIATGTMKAIFCPLVIYEQRNIVAADMHVGSILEALIFVQLVISTLKLVTLSVHWAPASTLTKRTRSKGVDRRLIAANGRPAPVSKRRQ